MPLSSQATLAVSMTVLSEFSEMNNDVKQLVTSFLNALARYIERMLEPSRS